MKVLPINRFIIANNFELLSFYPHSVYAASLVLEWFLVADTNSDII